MHLKNFVVYKSSAGSGKTFTLVKEFLRLALSDERKLQFQYKRILAITFTNKAAAEMKTRVIETLHNISTGAGNNTTGQLLAKELDVSLEVLQSRASMVLSSMLHNYSDLSIGTIDSFTHKIVRSFAHDLKLPVNFNIEIDTTVFYEKVVAQLLESIGDDAYVSKLLKDFALNNANDNLGWDPEKAIQDFTNLLQKEESNEYVDILLQLSVPELDEIRTQFLDFVKSYKTHLREEAGKVLDLIKSKNLSDENFFRKSTGPHKFFNKCYSTEVTLEDAEGKYLSEAIEKQQWQNNGKGADGSGVEAINPVLTSAAQSLVAYITENYKHFQLSQRLLQRMYPLMLVKKIEELTRQQKEEERLVFLSEFNEKIFELIQQEPTPFIYERLGERYQNYLLDEFQDTSSLQWQNLLPLLDNSLANGWFNLVVGDGKQSIYRWRSANVKQFADLPAVAGAEDNFILQERAGSLSRNYQEEVLTTNYRSSAEVVNFNNAIFRFLADSVLQDEQRKIYEGLEQNVYSTKKGYVSLHCGNTATDDLENITLSTALQQINDALADGYSYRDICVISRTNRHSFAVADYLLQFGIPVVSSDSLSLNNSEEVSVVVNYLQYLSDPDDKIAAAAVLEHVLKAQQTSSTEAHHYRKDIASGTALSTVLLKFDIVLPEDNFKLLNVFDAAVSIISALNLTAKGYQYLRFFLDEISNFLQNQTAGLADFLDWWAYRSKRASLLIPESTNAVKVMTMHVSKGLEFPVVILPFVNWELVKDAEKWVHLTSNKTNLPVSLLQLSKKSAELGFEKEYTTEVSEQNLDNLNLLYVAFTRAAERLHIIALKSEGHKKETVVKWIESYADAHLSKNEQGFYELGERVKHNKTFDKTTAAVYTLDPLQLNTGASAVTIKAAAKLSTEAGESALRQGVLLHWLLSMIEKPGDLTLALEKGLESGELNTTEVPDLEAKIARLLQNKLLHESFTGASKIWIEREIYSGSLGLLRPDRFTEHGHYNILLDYKTGKEQHQKYSKQLQKYQDALEQMGYKNIRKLLVYIDDEQVVELN